MNVTPENIIVNSCEYTPVYLIPSTGVTQAGSYIIAQSNQDAARPIDNLKTFYENSGTLDSGLLNSSKPRILKKQNASGVGNNLKLASFLLPKTEIISTVNIQTVNKQVITPPPVTNVIVKPVVTVVSTANNISCSGVDDTVPRVEMDRKIVRVGTIPNTTRTHYTRVLPKNKPKEKIDPNPSKHTSVQLIKLGETYHSLNQLSDDQMKIVNKALKMFSDPEKITKEPAYDPVTNTKFIYKVVSPKDLTVVGRNKVVMKKKNEVKKQKVIPVPEEPEPPVEPKVTRSGRTVKLPKQMRPGPKVSPQKPRKKVRSVVNCFQCSAEFCSIYRLQRHYHTYPTHIPTRVHSDLFHCLQAIIQGGGEDDRANIFIQQLQQLIEKLKTLLPCLLMKIDGTDGKPCTISDDICRLFGMNPGKYNLNMDALNCVKDKDGHCIHNPAPKNNLFNSDVSKPSQLWLTKHKEDIANNEAETEDCARINSVDKWPTVTKRIWKLKQQKQKLNAKKMRLSSENDQPIELVMEDAVSFNNANEDSAIKLEKDDTPLEVTTELKETITQPTIENVAPIENQMTKLKTHAHFHSAHFDIRSSPIKLPSSLARKFQFNPEKMSQLEVQILRPLTLDKDTDTDDHTQTDNNLQEIFRDNVELPKENEINNELSFETLKNWVNGPNETSHDSFMKSSMLFEPSLTTPEKNGSLIDPSLLHVDDKALFQPSPKTCGLLEASILETNNKSSSQIGSSIVNVDDKPNCLFAPSQTLLQGKQQPTGFYEPSSIHVKPKCNSLIGSSMLHIKNKSFEQALSHVKERSSNLFESTLLQANNKTNDNGFFQSDANLTKDDVRTINMDVNDGDSLTTNDGRLLSNQGQSVLNFLESLGNESLGLAYPETEIRNSSVDFQLDLFSYNNS